MIGERERRYLTMRATAEQSTCQTKGSRNAEPYILSGLFCVS